MYKNSRKIPKYIFQSLAQPVPFLLIINVVAQWPLQVDKFSFCIDGKQKDPQTLPVTTTPLCTMVRHRKNIINLIPSTQIKRFCKNARAAVRCAQCPKKGRKKCLLHPSCFSWGAGLRGFCLGAWLFFSCSIIFFKIAIISEKLECGRLAVCQKLCDARS